MSNHCRHRLAIKGKPEDVQRVLEQIRGLPGTPNEIMDLNRIIPAPASIDQLQEFRGLDIIGWAVRHRAKLTDFQRAWERARNKAWVETGCESVREWAQATWGSGSNVFEVKYGEDEPGVLYFSSLWMPVIPALVELSAAFPEVTLEITFAEEGGYYLGSGKIKGGKKRIKGYPIRTPEGRQIFEQFWGEWLGPEGEDEKDDDRVIDLNHKAAS